MILPVAGVRQVRVAQPAEFRRVVPPHGAELPALVLELGDRRSEELAIGVRRDVAEPAGRREPLDEREEVLARHVPDAAVGDALVYHEVQLSHRVVGAQRIVPLEVATVRTVLVEHRLRRRHVGGRSDHPRTRELVLGPRPENVRAQAQLVVEQQLVVAEIDRRPGHARGFHRSFLVQEAGGDAEVVLLSAARHGNRMVLSEARARHPVVPVVVRRSENGQDIRGLRRDGITELVVVQDVRLIRDLRTGDVSAIAEQGRLTRRLPAGSRLDQDHPVGTPGSIDRRRGGVLQDRERHDVVGIEEVQRVATRGQSAADLERHAVHDVQRLVAGVDRGAAANADRNAAARLTAVGLGDLHARDLTLDQFFGGHHPAGVEHLFRHLGDHAGVRGPLQLAVPDGHQRIELERGDRHQDLDVGRLPRTHGHLRLEPAVSEQVGRERMHAGGDVLDDEEALGRAEHGLARDGDGRVAEAREQTLVHHASPNRPLCRQTDRQRGSGERHGSQRDKEPSESRHRFASTDRVMIFRPFTASGSTAARRAFPFPTLIRIRLGGSESSGGTVVLRAGGKRRSRRQVSCQLPSRAVRGEAGPGRDFEERARTADGTGTGRGQSWIAESHNKLPNKKLYSFRWPLRLPSG